MSEGAKDRDSLLERFGGKEEYDQKMKDEKMDEIIMKVAQAALPANVLEIITKLTKLEEKIDRNHETINEKMDRIIRLLGVNET